MFNPNIYTVARLENFDVQNNDILNRAKDGFYLKITIVADKAMGEWKKLNVFERVFRWIFSRLLPCAVSSTVMKCQFLTLGALHTCKCKEPAQPQQVAQPIKPQDLGDTKPQEPVQPQQVALPPPVENVPQTKFEPFQLTPRDAPLNASIFGLKVDFDPKRGFPDVNADIKQQVLDDTKSKLSELVKDNILTDKGRELLKSLRGHVDFYPIKSDSILTQKASKAFINEGEVIQTPVKMEYDEKFERLSKAPKNFFYMHSTPAPEARKCGDLMNPAIRQKYLAEMKATIKAGMEAQIASGCKIVLWNYFGMGAFLRGVIKDRKEMYELRKEIAIQFFAAFEEVLVSMSDQDRKDFKLLITGPNGKSFAEKLKEEPRDNYNAFVLGAARSKYKENLVFCPETDAFVKAQELADAMDGVDIMAHISVMNAADSAILGNHWFNGLKAPGQMHANFAIDENGHRRSSSMAFFTYLINGGFAVQKNAKCADNINQLKGI